MTETITEYIQRDLRARLQTEGALPEDLTLEALSRHYRVSVTPVRRAVRALVLQRIGASGESREEANTN